MYVFELLRPAVRPLPSPCRRSVGVMTVAAALMATALAQQAQTPAQDIVFKNATVMTASHGTIEHGAVWVHAGKIAGVGEPKLKRGACRRVLAGLGFHAVACPQA